jgi:hypothetical protein
MMNSAIHLHNRGALNDYVDKKRLWVVQKSLFLSKFSGKNVHVVKKDQNCVHVVIECPPVGVVAAILCTMG